MATLRDQAIELLLAQGFSEEKLLLSYRLATGKKGQAHLFRCARDNGSLRWVGVVEGDKLTRLIPITSRERKWIGRYGNSDLAAYRIKAAKKRTE